MCLKCSWSFSSNSVHVWLLNQIYDIHELKIKWSTQFVFVFGIADFRVDFMKFGIPHFCLHLHFWTLIDWMQINLKILLSINELVHAHNWFWGTSLVRLTILCNVNSSLANCVCSYWWKGCFVRSAHI